MGDVTRLLQEWRDGDEGAKDALFTSVYDELHRLARIRLSRESTLSDLDAPALVNEAFMRLVRQESLPVETRRAFFGYAASVMRSVIVDYVRERDAAKRGDGATRVTLVTHQAAPDFRQQPDVVELDEALTDLARIDERSHRVVELRFFAGLSMEEIAELLEVSPATVSRDWEKARAFLYRALRA
ncbi:MAG TPA: ECF-type sigma factor [Nevskiaceae bacterium]|nr:ECF-type sigma factor [Nevskiaceae bacterium]